MSVLNTKLTMFVALVASVAAHSSLISAGSASWVLREKGRLPRPRLMPFEVHLDLLPGHTLPLQAVPNEAEPRPKQGGSIHAPRRGVAARSGQHTAAQTASDRPQAPRVENAADTEVAALVASEVTAAGIDRSALSVDTNDTGTRRGVSAGAGRRNDSPASPFADNPTPTYPPSAQRAGIEGDVLVRLSLLPSGRVDQVEMLAGEEIFRDGLERVMGLWRFHPAMKNGLPVPSQWTVRIPFRLMLEN